MTSFLVVPLPRFLKSASEQKSLIRDVDTWPPGFSQALEKENGWRQEQSTGRMTNKNLKRGRDNSLARTTTGVQQGAHSYYAGILLAAAQRNKAEHQKSENNWEKNFTFLGKTYLAGQHGKESKWNKLYWRQQPSSFKCSIIPNLSIVKDGRPRFTLVSKRGREEK